jgi:hypothetical protein
MKKLVISKFVIAWLVTLLTLLPFSPLAGLQSASGVSFAAQSKDIRTALPSAARTAATGNGDTVGIGDADTLVAYLDVTARVGGTLDVKIQDSPNGTTWFDLGGGAFSQVSSSTASASLSVSRVPSKYIRAYWAIGGGGGFTFSVTFMVYRGNPLVVATTDANAANLTTGTLPNARLSNVAASNLAEDVARTTSVTIPTASVLLLNGTPYTLISAPGSGKIILIEEISCKLVFNSVAYTGSNALEFRYTNGSGAKVTADLAAAFLNSASGTNYATVKSVVTAVTPVANSPIVAFVPSANPGAGNSDLVFTIKYRIITP